MMMPSLPEDVAAYHRTPTYTAETVPSGLLGRHSTKAGVWGRIVVTSGCLRYELLDRDAAFDLTAGEVGIIAPEAPHKVSPVGDVEFHVEFLR